MMENMLNLCQLNIEKIMFHVGDCLICIKMTRIVSSWGQMHGRVDHFKSHNDNFFTMVLHCTLLQFIVFLLGFIPKMISIKKIILSIWINQFGLANVTKSFQLTKG